MNRKQPVIKNEDYIIDIKGYGIDGEGVGKVEDFTIFIPGALKGEKCSVKIVKVNKNFAFGKLLDVIEKSPYRVEPSCKTYKKCGGCNLQHLSYEGQLQLKKERVEDCIYRLGKLPKNVIVHNTIGMKNIFRYRNKVQLPVGEKGGVINIGFYAERSHDIIPMDNCLIQHEEGDKIIQIIKTWMKDFNITAYNEKEHKGTVRHIMVRKGYKTGEVMVVVVTNERKLQGKDELIKAIRENISGIKSIVQNINKDKTNVVLGKECITLWGEDTISDYIGSFKFNISPLSFFQVNPEGTEVLYERALEYASLTGNEVVFDAYCGTGTISLFLSQRAKKVYGVEIVPEAVENAVKNAKANNVNNVEFLVGESEKIYPELIKKGVKADVVVVDPPRKGCGKELLEAIAKMNPKRVVYVSCDPATLGRDLGILMELGYETKEVQPVDMFPNTGHVENVVLLQRVDA